MDEPAKPFVHLKWVNGRTLDLATYMKEHPYMYAGDNVRAVFRGGHGAVCPEFRPGCDGARAKKTAEKCKKPVATSTGKIYLTEE